MVDGHDTRALDERVCGEVICKQCQGVGETSRERRGLSTALGGGVRSPRVPDERDSQCLQGIGGLTTAPPGPQREEVVRKHSDLLITGVSSDLLGA
jgi:hypothetical protein